ncbi:nuclear transport factor 2 family protein [Sulfitobacter mediterraneus]|uniref:nuclear transport factor 2 family protein n=1 Tax=Sulfitobacter mediterraneus TaxID=83219 RepID=UPI0021A54495|nr:nuclear transport factor 2 family protein [Sulfitobacter mediterraneus]UWR13207.1 nuclear transport factor 2 family protein [Sulfitobacter mediterraneus]
MTAAFHSDACLFDGEKGDFFGKPCGLFINDIGQLEPTSPFNLGQQPDSELLFVDWLSNVSAVVKLRIRARQDVYQDHLSMVKGAKGWKIVSKVWCLEKVVDQI